MNRAGFAEQTGSKNERVSRCGGGGGRCVRSEVDYGKEKVERDVWPVIRLIYARRNRTRHDLVAHQD